MLSASRIAIRRQWSGLAASYRIARRFRGDLLDHRKALTTAFLASFGFTLARIAEPWPLKIILDNVITGVPLRTGWPVADVWLSAGSHRLLTVCAMAIVGLAGLRGLLYYWRNVKTSEVGQAVVMKVRRRLFAHMLRLSLSFHQHRRTGDLLTRLTGDIILLRDLVVSTLLTTVSELLILLGFTAVMFALSWRLAATATLVVPVIFVVVSAYTGRIRSATRKQRRREGDLASRAHEALAGIHVVKLFAGEEGEVEALRKLTKRSLKSGLKTTRLEARMNRAIELALASASAAVLGFGALEVLAGRLSPGELVVFVAYMKGFYRPLRRISRVAERASKAATCVERVIEILDQSSDVPNGQHLPPVLAGELDFDIRHHAYASGVPVLEDLCLHVPAGKTVALVGMSGAGKSTLLSMVPRLQDPSDGELRIDGHDIRRFDLAALRAQISVVPQDALLFGGTIRENIAYGKPDASDAEIELAARVAQAEAFILALPEGYDSEIGERGVTLSGGQRQRIAIARALVKDAPIVLLDEPATGLDSVSEARVHAGLRALLRGRTALVIAHRLSTVQEADEIVLLRDGRIHARGRHAELLAGNAHYRELQQAATTRAGRGHERAKLGGPR